MSALKPAVTVTLEGSGDQLSMCCLSLEPLRLNKLLKTRKGEWQVYSMFTYFFSSPAIGLTFGVSLKVKQCDLLLSALGPLSVSVIGPTEVGTQKFFHSQLIKLTQKHHLQRFFFSYPSLSP